MADLVFRLYWLADHVLQLYFTKEVKDGNTRSRGGEIGPIPNLHSHPFPTHSLPLSLFHPPSLIFKKNPTYTPTDSLSALPQLPPFLTYTPTHSSLSTSSPPIPYLHFPYPHSLPLIPYPPPPIPYSHPTYPPALPSIPYPPPPFLIHTTLIHPPSNLFLIHTPLIHPPSHAFLIHPPTPHFLFTPHLSTLPPTHSVSTTHLSTLPAHSLSTSCLSTHPFLIHILFIHPPIPYPHPISPHPHPFLINTPLIHTHPFLTHAPFTHSLPLLINTHSLSTLPVPYPHPLLINTPPSLIHTPSHQLLIYTRSTHSLYTLSPIPHLHFHFFLICTLNYPYTPYIVLQPIPNLHQVWNSGDRKRARRD